MGELLATCPEEPWGPRPKGHTLGPGLGLGHALAQLEWRSVHRATGLTSPRGPKRGWLPQAWRRSRAGKAPDRMGMLYWCQGKGQKLRGEPSRQEQDLG